MPAASRSWMPPARDSQATVSPEPQWPTSSPSPVSPPARYTRYFASKDEIVVAVCEQGTEAFPKALTLEAVTDFLEHVRALARDKGHARLVAQIYAEAALSSALAAIVAQQLAEMRAAVAKLISDRSPNDVEQITEAFVTICSGYSQQLAVRGDLDSAPFTRALMAILQG